MKKIFSRKCPKKVKGMTLIEVLVALLVFGIASTLMVKIGSVAKAQLINSNHLNNKTQAEATIGSVKDKTTRNNLCVANSINPTEGEADVTFTIGTYGTITAKRYDTVVADKDAQTNGKNCDTSLDDNTSLQFYIMD